MAIAGNLQTDAAGQKFAGPVDTADGTGKAQRGANIDETEGYADGQVALMDHANANLDKADDAAVTLGTVRVLPVGMLADESAADSVDEGDIGLPRMSTARVPLAAICDKTGLEVTKVDDAAFTPATSIVVPIGALCDETAPDSVDEGDVGAPRMTANRLLRTIDTNLSGNNRSYRALATLQAAVARTLNSTINSTAVTGFGGYRQVVFLLTVSAKNLAGGGTLNVYIQASPDDGTTWDDVVSFTQITNGAVADGTYVAAISSNPAAGFADRATRQNTLAANNKVDYITDQLRVSTVGATMNGSTDTVTVKVEAVAIG